MKKYIMALDQGTSSSRCMLFDRAGGIVSLAQKEFTQYYPRPGWVEHDAMEIWSTQLGVAREAMSRVDARAGDIAAIGMANQRETTVVWDKLTGEPVAPAIVWQCRRSAGLCARLRQEGLAEEIRSRTGLPVDAYFSATKLQWLLDNVPGARARAEAGELLFGTIDSWLIWRLTRGAAHVTDYSNAARTMLFNLHTLDWDEYLLQALDIPRALLPEVKPSSWVYGESAPEFFGAPIPIAGAAGDQQAALFGQGCFAPGQAKNTYGTGCFMLMNTGAAPVFSAHGLITTVAWGLDGAVEYALEGSVFIAGAALQWLRDELKLVDNVAESDAIAQATPDTAGVYLVPAFVGLGAPYWQPEARGVIVGLTRGANRRQLVRAALEALAYQVGDVLAAMERDCGWELQTLRVDGGAAANDFLLQFQSDISCAAVERPACLETTALGAACLAGLAVGFWADKAEIASNWSLQRRFEPRMAAELRREKLQGWRRAVNAALAWARDDE